MVPCLDKPPSLMGWHRYPPIPNVLSMIKGIPCLWATAAIAGISGTLCFGLLIVVNIDCTRILVDRLVKFGRVVAHHPLNFNLEFLQIDPKLVETATVLLPRDALACPHMSDLGGGYLHQLVLIKL